MEQKKNFRQMSPGGGFVRHCYEKPAVRYGWLSGILPAAYDACWTCERRLLMANFLFVYRGNTEAYGKLTPEQMQQNMQKWNDWIAEGLQKGWLKDVGDALTPEGRVVNAKKVVTDGPFVESKEVVGGYSVVQANTIDAAAEFAKGCPILLTGGSVEVRPLAGMGKKS
jgi:hypothetical protein